LSLFDLTTGGQWRQVQNITTRGCQGAPAQTASAAALVAPDAIDAATSPDQAERGIRERGSPLAVTWDSLNANPPSLLWPPDAVKKWFPRTGLAGTTAAEAANGKSVAIIELRGWLTMVEGQCHVENIGQQSEDVDWRYDLEVDMEWLDSIGLAPEALMRPGDVIRVDSENRGAASVQAEVDARSSARAKYCEPIVHVELDGWPRKDARGNPDVPATWNFVNECMKLQIPVVWPFDPRHPKPADPPLEPGQYVRVVGSLVTDEPHMMQKWAETDLVLRLGFAAAEGLLGNEEVEAAQTNAIKWLWGPNRPPQDPTHPARWNEIHSPDYIEVFQPAKDRNETVRCLAIVAQNGLLAGDVEELTAEIRPPGQANRWQVLSSRKRLGPDTIGSTVLLDQMTPSSDRVTVQARVQGQPGLGASGKFFAVYRVSWRGIAPALHGAVSGNGQTLLGAVDRDGQTVARPGSGTSSTDWFELPYVRAMPAGQLTAVSRGPSYFDAFVVGTDGRVYTAATSLGRPWGGWWQIPGITVPQGARVDAVSRALSKLDIFCADDAGRVMSAAWQPSFTKWAGWWWIQQGVTAPGGAVTAVSRRQDYLDIFTVGTDGRIYTAAWDPNPPQTWKGWWAIGSDHAPVGAHVTCVSRSLDNLDVFVADGQGRVLAAHWDPASGWRAWTHVLSGLTGAGATLAAASRRANFLDIFVVGTDGRIYTAAWEPGSAVWRGWWALPGIQTQVGTPLFAFSPATDVLLVTTSSIDGRIVVNSWQPATGWTGWSSIS
jgi:hypothetical protein